MTGQPFDTLEPAPSSVGLSQGCAEGADSNVDEAFLDALLAAMCAPAIVVGSRVLVDGRPGVVTALPDLTVTCTVAYEVDHDGEIVSYIVNDWNPNAPKVVLA